MKLSKRKLNQIIQEEYNRMLQEQETGAMRPHESVGLYVPGEREDTRAPGTFPVRYTPEAQAARGAPHSQWPRDDLQTTEITREESDALAWDDERRAYPGGRGTIVGDPGLVKGAGTGYERGTRSQVGGPNRQRSSDDYRGHDVNLARSNAARDMGRGGYGQVATPQGHGGMSVPISGTPASGKDTGDWRTGGSQHPLDPLQEKLARQIKRYIYKNLRG
jgi:hypothetical protein